MSDIAIQVESIGKRYRIGREHRTNNFREAVMRTITSPLRRLRNPLTPEGDDSFWALKDVSFNVKRGEVVGVIGRNGAGKSTLLKILSRITEPTEGQAVINGRVGSLLEVGTGFHPELTGRENVYLNGAILGMKRGEIDKKFDEIVAFSEVEKFLDTPVKHYSSGMYMRLAFAVAAHLDPEILIVDEVLAVGDAEFQKKCLGKMQDVAGQGRTVLFVSHNMAAIRNLCLRSVMLEHGRVACEAAVEKVIHYYVGSMAVSSGHDLTGITARKGKGRVRFTHIHFEDDQGRTVEHGVSGQPLVIVLRYEAQNRAVLSNCRFSVSCRDSFEQLFFNCDSAMISTDKIDLPASGEARLRIPKLPLSGSEYALHPYVAMDHEMEDLPLVPVRLSVVDGDYFGTGKLYADGLAGKGVLIDYGWTFPDQTKGLSDSSDVIRAATQGGQSAA